MDKASINFRYKISKIWVQLWDNNVKLLFERDSTCQTVHLIDIQDRQVYILNALKLEKETHSTDG